MTATFLTATPRTEADCLPDQTDHCDDVTPPAGWLAAGVGSLATAEEILDWLENNGHSERELVILGESAFEVHWR